MGRKKTGPRSKPRFNRLALAAALTALVPVGASAWAPNALAATVTVDTVLNSDSSATTTNTADALTQEVIQKINDLAAATTFANDLEVTITLSGSQSVSASGDAFPTLFLNGAGEVSGIPTTMGLYSVTLDGGGKTIVGSGYAGDSGAMLGIENVSNSIDISNLVMAYGYSDAVSAQGGALYVGQNTVGGLDAFQSLSLDTVIFGRNTASGTGLAAGGGLSVNNETTWGATNGTAFLMDTDFIENSAVAGSTAMGGGGLINGVSYVGYYGGEVSDNTAEGGMMAGGGGLALTGGQAFSADIYGVDFIGNTAMSTGSGAGVFALGGGFFGADDESPVGAGSTIFFDSSTTFEGNRAIGLGTTDIALGGGAAFAGNVNATFSGTTLTGNTAEATLAGGGAVYSQGSVTIESAALTKNQANGAVAHGGAVFMDASVATNTANLASLTLNTWGSTDQVLISGNTANGQSSGIHFGNAEAAASLMDAELAITGEGRVKMLDALSVDLNNGAVFTLDKEDGGVFTWGASNNSLSATGVGGGAEINLMDGTTELTRYFSLAVTNNTVFEMNVTNAAPDKTALNFDSRRVGTQEMFNLTGAANTSAFQVQAGATMDLTDTKRQLVDFNKTYLVVKQTDAAHSLTGGFDNFTLGDNIDRSTFVIEGGNLMLKLKYDSPFKSDLARAGRNTQSAAVALTALMQYDEITDAMVDTIHENLGTATAEYGLVGGVVGVSTTDYISRTALRQGLKNEQNGTLPTPLYAQPQPAFGGAEEGVRVWGGYAGNYRNVDRSNGYYGYDQNSDAGVLGLSYDFGPTVSLGIYGGVSYTETEMDNINSRLKSHGAHGGLMARVSPMGEEDPNLAVYVDAGYASYDNDGQRRMAGYTRGSFDQETYTVGLGVEYASAVNESVLLTPSLDLRYINLDQDGFTEKGLTASRVNGYSVDSFTSTLALKVSNEVAFNSGTITPSARLGWKHEYGDTDYTSRASYLSPAGGYIPGSYQLGTVPVDRDSMDAGVAVRALFDSGSYHQVGLNVSYDVNLSKNSTTQTVYGGLEYRF